MNMNIPDTIETRARRQFKVGPKLYEGDLADIYAGTYMNGGGAQSVVLKIGRDRRPKWMSPSTGHLEADLPNNPPPVPRFPMARPWRLRSIPAFPAMP